MLCTQGWRTVGHCYGFALLRARNNALESFPEEFIGYLDEISSNLKCRVSEEMPVQVPRLLCGHYRLYKLEELETALFKEVLSRKHVLPPFPGKVSSHKCRQKQRTWFGNILDKSMFIRAGIYQRADSGLFIYMFWERDKRPVIQSNQPTVHRREGCQQEDGSALFLDVHGANLRIKPHFLSPGPMTSLLTKMHRNSCWTPTTQLVSIREISMCPLAWELFMLSNS